MNFAEFRPGFQSARSSGDDLNDDLIFRLEDEDELPGLINVYITMV